MKISVSTVHFHTNNIYKRLNLSEYAGNEGANAIRATKMLIKHGFVKL
jgi:DNA-binding NarL/FixJ family response regulator